jgi:hypothetical protein
LNNPILRVEIELIRRKVRDWDGVPVPGEMQGSGVEMAYGLELIKRGFTT